MSGDDAWTPERLRDTGWTEMADEGFPAHTGPFWQRIEGKQATCGFFADDRHGNRAGFVHGGMLATLADRTLGVTARLSEPARRQVTIDLTIHYIDAARMGDFVTGTGTLLRQTSALAFLSGRLEADSRLIANISGIWRIIPGTRTAGSGAHPRTNA